MPDEFVGGGNGGSLPSNRVDLNAAAYTASSGDWVLCAFNGLQTITLPTTFAIGDRIAIVRGNTVQDIHVVPGAGATIGGSSQFQSKADNVSLANIGGTLIVRAVSSTLWIPEIQESFWTSFNGSGIQFNDVMVHGTLYLPFNMWYQNVVSTSISMTVGGSSLVVLVTGAGGVTLTCDNSVGTSQVIYVKNNSTGSCTFVPNGTGTIDGAASIAIIPGQGTFLLATGPGGANTSFTNLSPQNPIGANARALALGVQFEPYPVVVAGQQTAPASGSIFGTSLYATAGAVLTGIEFRNGVAAAGTLPTTARFGLLDNTGKVLALSGNVNALASWAAGVNRIPFTAPFTTNYNGIYIPCFIVNGTWGTTQPTPVQASNAASAAFTADGASPPPGFSLAGQTDIPAVSSSVNITAGSTRHYYLPVY